MHRQLLNQAINIKIKCERKVQTDIIFLIMICYIIIIPAILFIIYIKGILSVFGFIWFIASFVLSWIIRSVYLKYNYSEAISEYKLNSGLLRPDIKYIEYWLFKKEINDSLQLKSKIKELINQIHSDLIVNIASLGEHRFTIFIFGLLLGLITNAVSSILWNYSVKYNSNNPSSLYFAYVLVGCAILLIPWHLSKGLLDRMNNKKRLREMYEYFNCIESE